MLSRFDLLPPELRELIYKKLHNNCLKNLNLEYKRKINNIKYKTLKNSWGERIKYNSNSQIYHLLENIDYFHILKKYDSTGPVLFISQVL